jgi:hypothetical protein
LEPHMYDRHEYHFCTAQQSSCVGNAVESQSLTRHARLLWLSAILAAFGLASLAVDCRLAQWCLSGHCPGTIKKALDLSEFFGHGYGVRLDHWELHRRYST